MRLRITIAGNTYEADVEVLEEDDISVPHAPSASPTYLTPPGGSASTTAVSGFHDPFDKTCRSPVTGLVIRVDVKPGQTIAANELLVVLEAMKMETRITAPCTGTVQSVHVTAGNSVKVNQPLIEVEWEIPPAEGEQK